MHRIILNDRTLVPEDGLILGNGDLSTSVYQTADCIIWKFGKSDVWDRRLDLSDDPPPAHIDEIARGIQVEGWKCGPYGGPVSAIRGASDPERMRELCQGAPPSYHQKPYPCPKPVGELAMYLPSDHRGMRIEQVLAIEDAAIRIRCSWPSGLELTTNTIVHPSINALLVRWEIRGWNNDSKTGNSIPPVRFAVYRWADPTVEDFRARFFGNYRHSLAAVGNDPKVTALPPPQLRNVDGQWTVEQKFPPEQTFPDGFGYLLTPYAPDCTIESLEGGETGEARLHILPQIATTDSWIAVAVSTESDDDGAGAQMKRVHELLKSQDSDPLPKRWEEESRQKSGTFWSRSSLSMTDKTLEDLWYQTLHVRRCTYRADVYPPGLFLPSTVQDYSHWHGDYHTNYNFQQPFWGDCAANHAELADAFFKGMEHFLMMGRKIAKDYYGCRGAFIQLTGYPIQSEEDCLGVVPMGRMAYMTGFVASNYWIRYRTTMDKRWLAEVGYPALRDFALFFTDFMKKGDDGRYHIFPSNQGEDGFSGDPMDYTDRAMVIRHARYCLRAAALASEELETDQTLRKTWRTMIEHMAPAEGDQIIDAEYYRTSRDEACPPEFLSGIGHDRVTIRREEAAKAAVALLHERDSWLWMWYCGKLPWVWMTAIRNDAFVADRDIPHIRGLIERWKHRNGILWAMSVGSYGHSGAWSESLGVIAPLQEMMLQSWDGVIRVFPFCPTDLSARFENWRAEGAFLVSASREEGTISDIKIHSEQGQQCTVANPWTGECIVSNNLDERIPLKQEADDLVSFETTAGEIYTVSRA